MTRDFAYIIMLGLFNLLLLGIVVWLAIKRARELADAKERETALYSENARLQYEVEQLSFDPLRIQRGNIFDHIRNFKGE